MPQPSNKSLSFFAVDALSAYSEAFLLLDRDNPVLLQLNNHRYSIHISSVHDSGGNRTNPDEQRIQIRRTVLDLQRQRATEGVTPLFIGFFPPRGLLFTAWEPAYAFSQNPRKGGTVYARLSHESAVARAGAALRLQPTRNLGRDTPVISLRSNALGLYLENWKVLHSIKDENELRAAIKKFAGTLDADDRTGKIDHEVLVAGTRRRITAIREAYARNPKFTERVLTAYDHTCCVCGRQLKLVQAAHIIPHSHPDCKDEISNGLALCIEHHKLYDDGLLLPRAGGVLHLNQDRVEHLKNIGQQSGLESLKALVINGYKIPPRAEHRPNDNFLERGFRIRLGEEA